MGSLKEIQLIGLVRQHGPYTFYKSLKIDGKILSVTSFFPVRIYPDSAMFSIAEVQLLWSDRAENFVSLRLYFLPENTPEGRRMHHGEDEVIALQDKVILRVSDISSWLVDESEWDWGYLLPGNGGNTLRDELTNMSTQPTSADMKKIISSDKNRDTSDNTAGSNRILVLDYQRYVRVRTVLKRLEGSSELNDWLNDPLVQALGLGGLNVGPNCRLLFSKEFFDYPELEDHELLCNHLAPKLKGRPRKRKRDRSLGSESNKSSSSTTSAASSEAKKKSLNGFSLVNPDTRIELEKEVNSPSSPTKSEGSESSHLPESPIENGNSGTGSDEGVRTECLTEKKMPKSNGVTVEPSVTQPLKNNGQFHRTKKRKRLNNSKTPCKKSGRISTTIELESTTIKLKSPPPPPPSTSPPPLIISTDEPNQLKEESLSPNCCEMEPSLMELAEKLEKTNALQILPMRPSVITKQDSTSDNLAPPQKKYKTDELANIPSITVSEVGRINHFKSEGATSGSGHKIEKSKLSLTGSVKGLPLTDLHKQNSKSGIHYPVFSNLKSISDRGISVTSIETDHKRNIILPPAATWCSPSQFVSTQKIYGDPCISKMKSTESTLTLRSLPNQNDLAHRTNGVSIPLGHESQSALDFSVKRQCKRDSDPPKSSHVNRNNLDGGCLDLSTTPHKSQKQVYQNISDIPPPNAMNQLGLRLTSEVTLYATHQAQFQKQSKRGLPQPPPPPPAPVQADSRKSNTIIQYNNHNHQYSTSAHQHHQLSMQGNQQTSRKQPLIQPQPRHIQEQHQQPVKRSNAEYSHSHPPSSTGTGPSIKQNSANVIYNNQSTNPKVWRPTSNTAPPPLLHQTGSNGGNISSYSRRDPMPFNHVSPNNNIRNNKIPSKQTQLPPPPPQHSLPPGTYLRLPHGVTSPPSPASGQGRMQRSPPKQSPVPPPSSHGLSQSHQMDRNGGMNFEQLASSFNNFMLPPPMGPITHYGQNPPDPSYFTPFGSPFQIPPSFLRLPPGTIESLQLAYMQQGLNPHFGNWPTTNHLPPTKEPRSQK